MWLERWECDGAWYRGELERDGTGIFVSCMGCNTFFHYSENEGGETVVFLLRYPSYFRRRTETPCFDSPLPDLRSTMNRECIG